MGDYDVCVMKQVTYTVYGANSEEEAIIQAIDYFRDDDMFYGTEEAENVTEEDCEIMWFEEY